MKNAILIISILFGLDTTADACNRCGRFGNRCAFNTHVAQQHVVVNKFVDIVPAAITFVPSQVVLDGQVAVYNNTNKSGLAYSYSSNRSSEDRVSQLEAKVDAILKALNAEQPDTADNPDDQASFKAQSQGTGLNVETIFKQACANCHGASPKDNTLALFDQDGKIKEKLPRYKIYDRITIPRGHEGHMPKGDKELNAEAKDAIKLWLHSGLKDLEY